MSEQSSATWLWWAQVVGIGAALLTAACTIGQWHFGGRLEQIRSDEARELLKRVQSEIGLPWPPLSESALHELKGVAIDMVPFASTTPPRLRVMFQTEGGQAFAEGIAEAFRRAKWDVECIRGGGFGPGIVVGPWKVWTRGGRLSQESDRNTAR